ncbi:hypothetical protein CYY_008148 [Polysphondylium violaceum]|uniref:Adenylate kinase n=1 Tax=Polysphondylium violaceum TaxID=133409 RepID=A0A8J4UX68_9MYCE|nr:hypothetical protein CYY_008148 [Polysphondylium violaceum]
MKILVFGASGSGTSTFSKYIQSKHPSYTHLESDDLFWLHKYSEKREVQERNRLLLSAINDTDDIVVAGSVLHWDSVLFGVFDLVVFMFVPNEIRVPRLLERERQRYGSLLDTDPKTILHHQKFIAWASGYDDPNCSWNLSLHNRWLDQLSSNTTKTTTVIRIAGDYNLEDSYQKLINDLHTLNLSL